MDESGIYWAFPELIGTDDFEKNGIDNSSSNKDEDDVPMDHDITLQCNFPGCGKIFHNRWSMTRHIRVHTGEKPFKCKYPGCNKEFVQKCSLTRHEQTHLDDKQWICDVIGCGKRFKLKEYLEVHKKTHVKNIGIGIPGSGVDGIHGNGNGNGGGNGGSDQPPTEVVKDATTLLIEQLRQRLVRMSVRHHEQIIGHQQHEQELLQLLGECTSALDQSISLLNIKGVVDIPKAITNTLEKCKQQNSKHDNSHYNINSGVANQMKLNSTTVPAAGVSNSSSSSTVASSTAVTASQVTSKGITPTQLQQPQQLPQNIPTNIGMNISSNKLQPIQLPPSMSIATMQSNIHVPIPVSSSTSILSNNNLGQVVMPLNGQLMQQHPLNASQLLLLQQQLKNNKSAIQLPSTVLNVLPVATTIPMTAVGAAAVHAAAMAAVPTVIADNNSYPNKLQKVANS